jgi:glycosyltransferase involved in cell wall biosynthesis
VNRTRVTVVDVIPTPYRVPLYRRLHESGTYDLRVRFCGRTHADRRWPEPSLEFPHAFLRDVAITRRGAGNVLTYHLNPGIWRSILAPRPDALLLCGWGQPTFLLGGALARAAGVPYLVNSESHGAHPRSVIARSIRRAVFQPFVRAAAAYLATGTRARSYLLELGAEPAEVFIFPNACDVEAIGAAADAARAAGESARLQRELAPNGLPLVLYVGRLVAVKGVDTLLDAVAALGRRGLPVSLTIAGDGPERGDLERRARSLDVRPVFLGEVAPDALPALYAAATVVCLPSRDEPWGVVVNEAYAAGTPVVASEACGAAADLVIPNETGERFAVDNAGELADALAHVLSDSGERGRRGRELVQHWGYARAEHGLAGALASIGLEPRPG